MRGIVDRIEGDYAVVEIDGDMKDIPISWFISRPNDGDSAIIDFEKKTAVIDASDTEKLKKEIDSLMDELF